MQLKKNHLISLFNLVNDKNKIYKCVNYCTSNVTFSGYRECSDRAFEVVCDKQVIPFSTNVTSRTSEGICYFKLNN